MNKNLYVAIKLLTSILFSFIVGIAAHLIYFFIIWDFTEINWLFIRAFIILIFIIEAFYLLNKE